MWLQWETYLIAEMEDNHLLNTIKFFLRRIKELSAILDSDGNILQMTRSQAALTGAKIAQDHFDPEVIQDRLQEGVEKLHPYVLEAVLRGMEIKELLQDAFGRTEKIQPVYTAPSQLLTEGKTYDYIGEVMEETIL